MYRAEIRLKRSQCQHVIRAEHHHLEHFTAICVRKLYFVRCVSYKRQKHLAWVSVVRVNLKIW